MWSFLYLCRSSSMKMVENVDYAVTIITVLLHELTSLVVSMEKGLKSSRTNRELSLRPQLILLKITWVSLLSIYVSSTTMVKLNLASIATPFYLKMVFQHIRFLVTSMFSIRKFAFPMAWLVSIASFVGLIPLETTGDLSTEVQLKENLVSDHKNTL